MVHESAADPAHTGSGYRQACGSNSLPHDPNAGSHDCPGALRHLHIGNDKSGSNSASCLPIPSVSQPLDAFANNIGAFDPTGYTDPVSLTGSMYPPKSPQGFDARRYAFMHEPCPE